ncbi:MAG: cob(I)yrinic acid a,c-diamide adenosyltransferase [Spirochaetota bacterium]
MKIYTKAGDKGRTSLASGKKVSKANDLVDLYGTCDELNSVIGSAISFLNSKSSLTEPLLAVQHTLFELGAELAGFRQKGEEVSIIHQGDISLLEDHIDGLSQKLEVMRSFILPGGVQSASMLHLARTICRRLERAMVRARESEVGIFDNSLTYVNRLSDFLFTTARYANLEEGVEDIKWTSRTKKK